MVGDVVGRPSKYRPEMCEEVIELSEKGWPMVKIAHHWGVTESNLRDWVHAGLSFSEQFSIAYKRARGAYTAYIMDKLDDGLFESKDRRLNAIAARALGAYARLNMDEKPLPRSGINSKEHAERLSSVLELAASGELTTKQLKDTVDSLATISKIEKIEVLEAQVAEMEEIIKTLTNEVKV